MPQVHMNDVVVSFGAEVGVRYMYCRLCALVELADKFASKYCSAPDVGYYNPETGAKGAAGATSDYSAIRAEIRKAAGLE